MKYLILEQKYLELIEDNRPMDALQCLRYEVQGLKIRTERTHELTTYEIQIDSKNYVELFCFVFLLDF